MIRNGKNGAQDARADGYKGVLKAFAVYVFTMLALALMSGCGSVPAKVPDAPKRALPVEHMAACEKLPELKNGHIVELGSLLAFSVVAHDDCSRRQRFLSDWIKRGE